MHTFTALPPIPNGRLGLVGLLEFHLVGLDIALMHYKFGITIINVLLHTTSFTKI